HGERRGVPAARRKAAEERLLRGFVVEVEGLRVELRGEGLDVLGRDGDGVRQVLLPHREVLEVMHLDYWLPVCTGTALFRVSAITLTPPSGPGRAAGPRASSRGSPPR